jgi:hypothetical protein
MGSQPHRTLTDRKRLPMTEPAETLLDDIREAERAGDHAAALLAYVRHLAVEPRAGWAGLNVGVAAQQSAETCLRNALAVGSEELHKAHMSLAKHFLSEDRTDPLDHGREGVRLKPDFADG